MTRHYADDSDNAAWVENTPAGGGAASITRLVEGVSSQLGAMIAGTGEATISLPDPHGDNVAGVTIPADTSGQAASAGIACWEDRTEYGGPAITSAGGAGNAAVVGPIGYGWLGARNEPRQWKQLA